MDNQKTESESLAKKDYDSIGSLTKMIKLGCFASGITHGFCDSKNIPLNPLLEDLLTYAPTLAYCGTSIGTSRLILNTGVTIPPEDYTKFKESPQEDKRRVIIGTYVGSVVFTTLIGAGLTALGYGLGYGAGKSLEYFT